VVDPSEPRYKGLSTFSTFTSPRSGPSRTPTFRGDMEQFWLGSPDVSPAGLSPQKRIRRDEDVSFSSEDDQQSTNYANLSPEIPDPAKPVTLDEALDLSQFQPQAPHDQGLDLINVNTICPTDPLAPDKHCLRDRPFDCIHQTCQIIDQSETQSSTIGTFHSPSLPSYTLYTKRVSNRRANHRLFMTRVPN
jgi:hypothetical protein